MARDVQETAIDVSPQPEAGANREPVQAKTDSRSLSDETIAMDGGQSTPHAILDEDTLPDGWTISTAVPKHTALYHEPTGRSISAVPTSKAAGWTVMGVANYGGDAVFARDVDIQQAARLLLEEATAGTAGDWTDSPTTSDDAPGLASDSESESETEPSDEPTGQKSLGDW